MKTNRELIDHIKEVLQQHEEPYKQGSWENFVQHQENIVPFKKKKNKFLYGAVAAGIIVLLGAGLWALLAPSSDNNQLANTNKSIQTQQPSGITPTQTPVIISDSQNVASQITVQNNQTEIQEQNTANRSILQRIKETIFPEKQNNTAQPVYAEQSNVPAHQNNNNQKVAEPQNQYVKTPNKNIINNPQKTDEVQQPSSSNQNQAQQQYIPNVYAQNNSVYEEDNDFKRWNFAAQVASSVSNTSKMNMSYGVNVGYSFNDKIAIHSGVAYTQLNSAIQNAPVNNTPMMFASANNSAYGGRSSLMASNTQQPKAESSELRLSGVEIPVEVRYNVNKKMYTSVGVSAMALVENTQKNTYLIESPTSVGFSTASDNAVSNVLERREETVPGTNVVNDKFLEFFNLSFGYKQPISNKRNIKIEPFVKIPISGSGVKTPLTNAGIRLGVEL